MTTELTKAAQAALNACERIVDQEDSPVQFGIDFRALGSSLRRALTQRPAAQEVEISTKHGPWLPSRHHEGETYCERCLTRSVFASSRACDPHIVTAPQQATPEPVGEVVAYREKLTGRLCEPEDTHRRKFPMCYEPLTRPAAAPAVPEDSALLDYLDTLAARAAGSDLHCFGGRVVLYVRTGVGSHVQASGAGTAREAIRAAMLATKPPRSRASDRA